MAIPAGAEELKMPNPGGGTLTFPSEDTASHVLILNQLDILESRAGDKNVTLVV